MLVAATCALEREYDARSVVTRGRRRGTHLTGVASRCFASEAALLDNLCAAVFAALRAASGVRTRARCPLSSSVVSTSGVAVYHGGQRCYYHLTAMDTHTTTGAASLRRSSTHRMRHTFMFHQHACSPALVYLLVLRFHMRSCRTDSHPSSSHSAPLEVLET